MTDTTHLALPYLDAAQAQKHVTHNDALSLLDLLVQLSVLTRNVVTPPGAPTDGARYLVATGATGVFATFDNQVAAMRDGAWRFLAPQAGWIVHVADEQVLLFFDGSQWRDLGSGLHALDNLSHLGIATSADTGNPLSAKLNAALFTARATSENGTGDLRFTLNKSTAGNTVSQLYQTNYSGRAETGLTGDDHFHVKVSADGAAWHESLNIDPASGIVSFPAGTSGVLPDTASAAGETGVINGQYAVGDVRRYGVFPDAVVLASVTLTSGSATVAAAAGTFTAAMVGKTLRCRDTVQVISARASDGSSITLAANAANTWSGAAVVGTNWEVQYAGFVSAIYANATLANVEVRWPVGLYNTGLNFTNTSSNTKMAFDGGAEFAGIFHVVTADASIMRNCRFRGGITTGDRFGTINLQDSFIERVHVKDMTGYGLNPPRGAHLSTLAANLDIREMLIDGCSPSNGDGAFSCDDQNSSKVRVARLRIKDSDVSGCNIFGRAHTFGEIVIEGFGAGVYTNSGILGAYNQSAELAGINLYRCPELKIEMLRLDQKLANAIACTLTSGSTAVTATGFLAALRVGQAVMGTGIVAHALSGVTTANGSAAITGSGFSALRVGQPVSGTGIPSGAFLAAVASDTAATLSNPATASGTITLAAPCIVTAIGSDTSITLSNAATASGVQSLTFNRPNALYALRILETDVGAGPGKINVQSLVAENVMRRGLSVGDAVFPVANSTVAEIGSIDITFAQAALDAGWRGLTVTRPSSGVTRLIGNRLTRFVNPYGNDCLYAGTNAELDIGLLDANQMTLPGTSVQGRTIQFYGQGQIGRIESYGAGNSSSATPITIGNTNTGPIRVGAIVATAYGSAAITTIAVDLTNGIDLDVGPVSTYGYRGYAAVVCNGLQRSNLRLHRLYESSATGWGLRLQGATDVKVFGGLVTGFAYGTYSTAATNVRCTFYDVVSTGNTTNTNMANGQAVLVGNCVTATL